MREPVNNLEELAARPKSQPSRRMVVGGLLLTVLDGCTTAGVPLLGANGSTSDKFRAMYGALEQEKFPVPAVRLSQMKRAYLRREVDYASQEKPGTIIVDPHEKFLYLVQENARALRYGIGVGRQGFSWNGRAKIGWKRKWPTWTPPAEMIEREPGLAEYADGMEPGLDNPLGARALYLVAGGKDTLYRIHGTREANSIGKSVSSGCIRLLNQDVIDLFERVERGAIVVVLGSGSHLAQSPGHLHSG